MGISGDVRDIRIAGILRTCKTKEHSICRMSGRRLNLRHWHALSSKCSCNTHAIGDPDLLLDSIDAPPLFFPPDQVKVRRVSDC